MILFNVLYLVYLSASTYSTSESKYLHSSAKDRGCANSAESEIGLVLATMEPTKDGNPRTTTFPQDDDENLDDLDGKVAYLCLRVYRLLIVLTVLAIFLRRARSILERTHTVQATPSAIPSFRFKRKTKVTTPRCCARSPATPNRRNR
jgi:hypothetical protein